MLRFGTFHATFVLKEMRFESAPIKSHDNEKLIRRGNAFILNSSAREMCKIRKKKSLIFSNRSKWRSGGMTKEPPHPPTQGSSDASEDSVEKRNPSCTRIPSLTTRIEPDAT